MASVPGRAAGSAPDARRPLAVCCCGRSPSSCGRDVRPCAVRCEKRLFSESSAVEGAADDAPLRHSATPVAGGQPVPRAARRRGGGSRSPASAVARTGCAVVTSLASSSSSSAPVLLAP